MSHRQGLFLNFDIKAQPDEVTCGPTCLHTLYEFYKDSISLKEVVQEVKQLKNGGPLGVMLGKNLKKQMRYKFKSKKLKMASKAYIEFLDAG